jgi:hypothetical protein
MSPRIPRPDGRVPESAQTFMQQVSALGAWKGDLAPATSLSAIGAQAMSRLVLAHPAVADGVRPETPLALFGGTDDPRLEGLRSDALGYLIGGALALGMTGQDIDKLAERLVFAGVSIDPASLLQRERLRGGKPVGPPPPVIPDWLDQIAEFVGRNCFAGVVGAVLELGKWAGGGSTSDATGISSLSPTTVCGGTPLSILGSGFGPTQPAGTKVYVPTVNGCREATVTQWSDTQIVVQLPSDVSAGCVGFVRGGGQGLGEPQRVTGELTNCIGAAAEAWTRGFSKVGKSVIVSCPPCLPGGQNHLQAGGRPVINTFRFTPARVEPGGQPVLSWNVSNVTSLQIAAAGGNGPALALPSPLPPVGSITLAPVGGLVPVHGNYRLTATNACGTATADAAFDMSRTPQLSVIRIEVVQSIQTVTNSVHLTANRATAVRVFVDSGISDGFNLGAGPNRVAGVTASLLAEDLSNGSLRDCGSPWPGSQATPAPNRDLLADSFNFDVPLSATTGLVRFHAFVEYRPSAGQPPVSSAAGTVDVVFTPRQKQELLPILITDPSSASATPTLADFFANFNNPAGPAHAEPFMQGGFTVNPTLTMTLSGAESLKSGINWSWIVVRLTTMIFLFPSTPVGGIRSGIVPADSAYPWGGMALPRVGATAPAFIAQAGQPQTTAHELGHTFGQLHVNCGGPAGPFGGLPLTISDPGIDVLNRSIVPAGSNELMSYCYPQWPSIPLWESMFNSIPVS